MSWTRSREEFLDGTHLAMCPEYRSSYWYGYDTRCESRSLAHGEKAAVRRALEALAAMRPEFRHATADAGVQGIRTAEI